jgi:serine/threonine protein kinase
VEFCTERSGLPSEKLDPNWKLLPVLASCDEPFACLVYPYMSNGCVKDRLQCLSRTPPLRFALRLRIALDVASSICGLHEKVGVVHADVSSSNILLDGNLTAFLSDFGLSQKIHPLKDDTSELKGAAARSLSMCSSGYHKGGQVGYLDPEHNLGKVTKPESDVYSFGVVLLELLTGQAACDEFESPPELVERVRKATGNGIPADPNAMWPQDVERELMQLAVQCVNPRGAHRPTGVNPPPHRLNNRPTGVNPPPDSLNHRPTGVNPPPHKSNRRPTGVNPTPYK